MNKINLANRVANRDRRFGSDRHYHPVHIIKLDGSRVWALLTDDAVTKGMERAEVNKEDLPKITWWRCLLDWLLG